jgi:hypothetical protein
MKFILCTICVFFNAWCVHGQATLQADSTSLLIGDQVNIRLRVASMQGTVWTNPESALPDTLSSIEMIKSEPMIEDLSSGQKYFEKEWLISVFDTGYIRIPKLKVILSGEDRNDTIYSNDLPLFVAEVPPDSTGLAPIKPIISEPVKLVDFLPVILTVVGLAVITLLIIYFKRKEKQSPAEIIIRDPRPADVIAMEELDALERKKVWQKGDIKAYHSELSHIIRAYLERRYSILALESTTDEIVGQLQNLGINEILLSKTKEMMQLMDMVKFAKAQPPLEVHPSYLENAKQFVRATRVVIDDETKAEPV